MENGPPGSRHLRCYRDKIIWQRGFYDHVIRNKHDYDSIVKYIYENPICWEYAQLYRD